MLRRAVFGLQAAVYAAQIPRDAPVLIADPDGALDALVEAVRRRRAGQDFAVWPLVRDRRSAQALDIAANLAQRFPDYDAQRQAFAALADGSLTIDGKAQFSVTFVDPRRLETLYDLVRLGQRTIAGSWTEAARLRTLFPEMPEPLIVVPRLPEALVPAARAGNGKAVVVWAPRLAPRETAIHAFALRELRMPVTIVAHDAAPSRHNATYVGPNDAAGALADACAIVDASLGKASTAIALAGLGAPLCVSSVSGAREYLDGVRVYDPWNAASIFAAVSASLGDPPAVLRIDTRSAPFPQIASHDPVQGPLVSIVVRTRDRADFLKRALESIAVQRYRDVEAIVVNDGGVDVRALVEHYRFARLITLEQRSGRTAAANRGLHAALGTYAGLLDDDDIMFPDHVGALAGALERSGASAAACGAISAFARRSAEGYVVEGYRVTLAGHVDRIDLHTDDRLPPMGVMFRRAILPAIGDFNESLTFAEDWEMWLRISSRFDVVHVPRITAMYTVRQGDANAMSVPGLAYAQTLRAMQARYPLAERPERERVRQSMIETYSSGAISAQWPQPALTLVPPQPLV